MMPRNPARLLCVGALTRRYRLPLPGAADVSRQVCVRRDHLHGCRYGRERGRVGGTPGRGGLALGQRGRRSRGSRRFAELESEGVNCDAVRRVPKGRSASAVTFVDTAGERITAVHYDPRTQAPPNSFPFPSPLPFDAVLADVRWPDAAGMALTIAQEAGIPAILDADVAPLPTIRGLAGLATHVVASEPVALAVAGGATATVCDGVRALGELTTGFAAVTAGSQGTYFLDRASDTVLRVASPAINAVDTLAAGDVFHGCFATAIAERTPLVPAIAFAAAAAALKCLKFGGRLGAPNRQQTMAFLSENSLAPTLAE